MTSNPGTKNDKISSKSNVEDNSPPTFLE